MTKYSDYVYVLFYSVEDGSTVQRTGTVYSTVQCTVYNVQYCTLVTTGYSRLVRMHALCSP